MDGTAMARDSKSLIEWTNHAVVFIGSKLIWLVITNNIGKVVFCYKTQKQ